MPLPYADEIFSVLLIATLMVHLFVKSLKTWLYHNKTVSDMRNVNDSNFGIQNVQKGKIFRSWTLAQELI